MYICKCICICIYIARPHLRSQFLRHQARVVMVAAGWSGAAAVGECRRPGALCGCIIYIYIYIYTQYACIKFTNPNTVNRNERAAVR